MIDGTKPMKMAAKSAMKVKAEKAMKLKEEAAMKEKMNMVKGPDGKMVPDFAVDGKGANDMKKSAKQLKEAAMKLKEEKTPMKDDRSLIQRAKDEAKQIKAGVQSFIKGNPSRTRYGSSTISQEIRDFKSGYKAEEEKQKATRTGSSPKPMKKDAAMKLKEKPMKMKEKAAMKMGHSPKKMGHKK